MSYTPRNVNGQAAMANSEPVVIASDQSTLPVTGSIADQDPDSGNPIKVGARYNATQPTYTDGDRGDFQINSRGELIVRLYSAANAIAAVVTNADAVATSSTVSKLQTASLGYVFNGTTFDRARGDTTGTYIVGSIAHDTADSSNPVKIGGKAIAALSGATLVAAADRTDLYADLDGVQINRPNSAIGDYVSGQATNTDGTSTQVLAAGAAGVKHYLTDVTIANSSATPITVDMKDGSTIKWTFPVPANAGVTHSFRTPLGGTAATAWNFDPSAAATTVSCSVSGFKSKI